MNARKRMLYAAEAGTILIAILIVLGQFGVLPHWLWFVFPLGILAVAILATIADPSGTADHG